MSIVAEDRLPMTVGEYADAAGVSKSCVRYRIRRGYLAVAGSRPQKITRQSLPVTLDAWKSAVLSIKSPVPPHLVGFDEGGAFCVLVGSKVVKFEKPARSQLLTQAVSDVESFLGAVE